MQSSAIFPLFYLPPISYFSALYSLDGHFLIEKFEHFPKQTYRNRATILSPNGNLDLIIPVVKGAKVHTAVKDVKISYDLKWQRLHWLSLQNCYSGSAYFEFYEDELVKFFEKRYNFLFDYNLDFLFWILKQIKLNLNPGFTSEYEEAIPVSLDYRTQFDKKTIYLVETKPYFQVFSDRQAFKPNLSIADLLFNQGPQTKLYL